MKQSNSGMMGHGMPAGSSTTNNVKKAKPIKNRKSDATMYQPLDAEPMFAGVKTDEGIIITCGKYRVSKKTFETFEAANDYVASKPYEILINVSVLFAKITENENKEITKENPQSEHKITKD